MVSKLKRLGVQAKVGFMLDQMPNPQKIFKKIQTKGELSTTEMYRTFNMGIGFLIVCPKRNSKLMRRILPEAQEVGYVDSSRKASVSIGGNEFELEKW